MEPPSHWTLRKHTIGIDLPAVSWPGSGRQAVGRRRCDDSGMEFLRPSIPRTPGRRRRLGVTAGCANLLGTSVDAAVPLQRHSPPLVLAVCAAELVAAAGLILTGSLGAFAAVVALSVVLVLVVATNQRRILCLTRQGNVLLLASTTAWPTAVSGPVEGQPLLPEPRGLGAAVTIDGRTWWIDRSSYQSLARARAVQAGNKDE
jgi:hypothetical protein